MFKRKKTIIVLALLIMLAGGVFYFKNKKPKTDYTIQEVERGTLSQTVSVTGKLAAPEQTDLSFKASGRLESILVDVGDRVEKGQKIATIDKGSLYSQLSGAKHDVKSQQQTLALMKRGGYRVEAERSQKEKVRSAQAAVSQIFDQLKETTLYSPIDGIIITRNVNVGEVTVANAVTANTSVVTIAKEGDLEITSNVPESDIVKVVLGQKADVTLDAFALQDMFPAEVVEIEPAATVIQDVVYYKVKLRFITSDNRFKNGMSADVEIKTSQKNNVVFIPERAIKEDNGKKYVEIMKDEKTGAVEKTFVTTGLRGDEGMIEIVSGLSGGEKIVTFAKTP